MNCFSLIVLICPILHTAITHTTEHKVTENFLYQCNLYLQKFDNTIKKSYEIIHKMQILQHTSL